MLSRSADTWMFSWTRTRILSVRGEKWTAQHFTLNIYHPLYKVRLWAHKRPVTQSTTMILYNTADTQPRSAGKVSAVPIIRELHPCIPCTTWDEKCIFSNCWLCPWKQFGLLTLKCLAPEGLIFPQDHTFLSETSFWQPCVQQSFPSPGDRYCF